MSDSEAFFARYRDVIKSGEEPPDGIECGLGWIPILDRLLNEIAVALRESEIRKFRIIQIKEKFGGLRVYTKRGNARIFSLIVEAEMEAWKTCEVCGAFGEPDGESQAGIRCVTHANYLKSK